MAEETGPLKQEDLVQLRDNLKQLDLADLEIDKAIRAGLDMTGQKARTVELRSQLTKVKQAYFPGQ